MLFHIVFLLKVCFCIGIAMRAHTARTHTHTHACTRNFHNNHVILQVLFGSELCNTSEDELILKR